MNGFDGPGEGWREVQAADVGPGQRYLITIDADLVNRPDVKRYWVREVPVPPLPTTPYTVIGIGDWRLTRLEPYEAGLPGAWEMLPIPKAVASSVEDAGARMQCAYGDEWVRAEAEQHGGFKVLAAPISEGSAVYTSEQLNAIIDGARAGTAKAVVERVRQEGLIRILIAVNPRNGDAFDAIAREFGVDQ